jgi:colicin import membrane protein
MKTLLMCAALGLCQVTALAQGAGANDWAGSVRQERTRISALRQQVYQRHADQEVQCYKRFAVTDCLNEARAQRREALADLRRQDLLLNDEGRKRRAADQLQRIESGPAAGTDQP